MSYCLKFILSGLYTRLLAMPLGWYANQNLLSLSIYGASFNPGVFLLTWSNLYAVESLQNPKLAIQSYELLKIGVSMLWNYNVVCIYIKNFTIQSISSETLQYKGNLLFGHIMLATFEIILHILTVNTALEIVTLKNIMLLLCLSIFLETSHFGQIL